MQAVGVREFFRATKGSIGAAVVLLAWDVGMTGSFLMSTLFCPIWFLVSLLRSEKERLGWRLALVRIGIPLLTLGLVWANNKLQLGIAEANAQRVVSACEAYHAAHGEFPETLDELVPKYLKSVPVAKYCLQGRFLYFPHSPMLVWHVVPPYYRKIYNFETRNWSYLE